MKIKPTTSKFNEGSKNVRIQVGPVNPNPTANRKYPVMMHTHLDIKLKAILSTNIEVIA